jgi:hypothetical protein
MNAHESENYLPISRSVHQSSVEIFWAEIYQGRLLTLITGSSSRLLRIRFSADLTMYWFPVCHFRCMKFKPLVIWIWNQNIAISTIVGTSSHIIRLPDCLHKLLMIEIKRKKESNVFVIFYVKSGSLITPSCEDYKV